MQFTPEKLAEILEKHAKWLLDEPDGKRANLYEANLSKVNLSRANLYEANLSRANLYEANLSKVNLSGANLYEANLSGANLYEANLSGANLYEANLSGANLYGANLYEANLYEAKGISKYRTTPLYVLQDQVGKIRAYKLVNKKSEGPYNGGIKYEMNKSYSVNEWDEDEYNQCGAGINLATLDWCMRRWGEGYRILIAEFIAKDIVCIPIASDGKFRVKKCKIVGEKDLGELGLSSSTQGGE